MNRLKEFMPKFYDIYATDCDRDQPWSRTTLDKMILLKQQKRQMEVEDAVRTKLLGIRSKVNQVKGDSRSPKKKPKSGVSQGMTGLSIGLVLRASTASRATTMTTAAITTKTTSSMKANLPAESTPSREAKEATEAEVVAEALEAPVGKVEARAATPPDPNTIAPPAETSKKKTTSGWVTTSRPATAQAVGMEGESIGKCRRVQREQHQSTWRQSSDKTQGSIPNDHEQESDESEEQSDDWKSADEDDQEQSVTNFLMKAEKEGAFKSETCRSWYNMGSRMMRIEAQDLFTPTPQIAKALRLRMQPCIDELENAWRGEMVDAAMTAEADSQVAETQLQGILEYAIKLRRNDTASYTTEEKTELAKALRITAPKQVPISNEGEPQPKQMDSGCCGFMVLKGPRFYLRGRANGSKIEIHIAKAGDPDTAESYGAPIASVPTTSDPIIRRPEQRKIVELSLGICDDRHNDLVNENRFTSNLDGTRTPHHVDKENKCIWFYKGLENQFIVPLEWDSDQMHPR
jgi:hypothetical protein